jgi:predicted permease
MRWLVELSRRIWYLIRRERVAADLDEEMRLHIELREARLREQGQDPASARYAARRRFGNKSNLQDRSRDAWGLNWIDHAAADLRFAVRRLRNRPGFAMATIVVAALGIGATTAVFSAIDATMLRGLPFARSSELVTLTDVSIPFDPGAQQFPSGHHFTDFNDVAAMRDVFSSVAAFAAGGLNLTDPTRPRRVRVGVVTAGFFTTLGVRTQSGRVFNDAEAHPGGASSVILSDAVWRSTFGARDVTGTSIDLSGTRYTIVGVMEPGFDFPNESELWIPLTVPTTFATFAPFRGFLPSRVIARVAPGMSVAAANTRLLDTWRRLAGPPDHSARSNLESMIAEVRETGAAVPLQRSLVGQNERALIILMGATALLLLIACANVANLLLSDAASRRREVALREVLGATRGRIVRQLLAESVLLAIAGAALGVACAPAVLHVLRAMMPADLAGVAPAKLDLRVLIFATGLALVTGLTFGLWPALGTARADAGEIIKSGGSGGATASGLGMTRRTLITAELALTVMLLVASGLMLRSLDRVLSQPLGMDPEHVGTLEISFRPGSRRAEKIAKLHAILARLDADPSIGGAGVVNDIPLRGGGGISLSIEVAGAPKPKSIDEMVFARNLSTSAGYFNAMGIPLLRGRTFTPSDDSLAPEVAVINMAMAKRYWPGTDAIGRTFGFAGRPGSVTVVGIVADVRERNLERDVAPQMYFPIDRNAPDNVAIAARSSLPPGTLLARLTDAVHSVDRSQAVYNVRMMEDVISTSVAPRRTNTTLIAIFGALALLLSAFGVYAVVSFSVTRRTREFGIRAALGASGRNIAALVGGEMMWIVGLGLALGLAGAWILSRVMTSLLYGVDVHDTATFVAVPLALIVPAAIATLVPTWRAMRVDPTEVMRAE